jgi:hypothetical protein
VRTQFSATESFEPGIRCAVIIHGDHAGRNSKCFTRAPTPSHENRRSVRHGGQSYDGRPSGERSRTSGRARDASLIARDGAITWSGCIHRQCNKVRHKVELRDDNLVAGQGNVAGAGPSASIAPSDESRPCCWSRSQCDQTIGWEGRAASASAIDTSLIGTRHGPGSRSNLLH